MKTKVILLLSVIITFCSSCEEENTGIKYCSCLNIDGQTDRYTFPVQPGSIEWKGLKSHREMVDACQIPKNILKRMCTVGLIDTYLDYPLLFTIFAFNNTNEGLQQIKTEFNGFPELLKRDDCATLFLQKYKLIDPTSVKHMSDSVEIGFFMQRIRFFELTLGFEPLRNKFTQSECKTIIEVGLKNLEKKEANNYGSFSLITNIYLLAKILELEQDHSFLEYQKKNPHIGLFLKGNLIYFNYKKEHLPIKNICQEYLKRTI